MAWPIYAALAGVSIVQGVMQSNAQREQGAYQRRMAEENARNQELFAQRVLEKGNLDAQIYQSKVNQTLRNQKVAYASQGVSLDSDVVKSVHEDTFDSGYEDAQQIRNNAFLDALGYKTQASDYRRQGYYAEKAANSSANATLIGSGLNAANTMLAYRYGGKS